MAARIARFCHFLALLLALADMPGEGVAAPQTAAPELPIVPTDSISVTADLKAALVALEEQRLEEAIADAHKALATAPDARIRVLAQEVLGTATALAGNTAAGERILRSALASAPGRISLIYKLGLLAEHADRTGDARRLYETALRIEPANRAVLARLAVLTEAMGDAPATMAALERLMAAGESTPAIRASLADAYNRLGRYDRSAALFAETEPRDVRGLAALGVALIGLGDGPRALGSLAAARRLSPGNQRLALLQGVAQRLAGDMAAAAATFGAIAGDPSLNAVAQFQLGLTLLMQDRREEAQPLLAAAVAQAPDNAQMLRDYAQILVGANRADQAIALLASSSRAPEASLESYVSWASMLQALDRPDAAEQAYQEALARFPEAPAAHWRLGAMLAFRGKYEEAAQVLAAGRRLAPEDPTILRVLAQVQARLGHIGEATDLARRLTGLQPNNLGYRFLLADLLERGGAPREAIPVYRFILARVPEQPVALNNLASVLTETGDAPAAVDLARKAVAALPGDASPHDTLGWALVRADRPEEGLHALRRAAELRPDDPVILYHSAVAELALGNRAAARGIAQRALVLPQPTEQARATDLLLHRIER